LNPARNLCEEVVFVFIGVRFMNWLLRVCFWCLALGWALSSDVLAVTKDAPFGFIAGRNVFKLQQPPAPVPPVQPVVPKTMPKVIVTGLTDVCGRRQVLAEISEPGRPTLMAVLAGGAARRESVTVDEIAHIGAGVSYLQKLDLRMNEEHPPLAKVLAGLPLVLRRVHGDYSHLSWTFSNKNFNQFLGEWVFGHWLIMRWNDPYSTVLWARVPMLLLTLLLGLAVGRRLLRIDGVALLVHPFIDLRTRHGHSEREDQGVDPGRAAQVSGDCGQDGCVEQIQGVADWRGLFAAHGRWQGRGAECGLPARRVFCGFYGG